MKKNYQHDAKVQVKTAKISFAELHQFYVTLAREKNG
jgi:hypothetical protein